MRVLPPVVRRLALLALLALLVAPFAGASVSNAEGDASDGWEPKDPVEGAGYAYQVFARKTEGDDTVRYRVRGTIRARADSLPGSVRVIASDPEWVPDGQSRRVLVNTPDEFVVYTRIDLPTFFSDRDIVSRGVRSSDPQSGAYKIDWKAVEHAQAPPVDGVIRIVRGQGSWEFTQADADTSRVDYETFIDLGGSLPAWLIQPLMAGNVAKNFEDLARHALAVRTASTEAVPSGAP